MSLSRERLTVTVTSPLERSTIRGGSASVGPIFKRWIPPMQSDRDDASG
jgi:hypothetical protein